MSTNISEGLPAKKKAAPVVDAPKGGEKPGGKKGGTAENSAKRIRQAVYDIRYRARREDIDLKQAFSQYMSNTSMDQKERTEVRGKLFGKGGGVSEQYVGASDDWAIESMSKALSHVFEHHQKDKDGNTVPHEDEIVTEYEQRLSEEKSRKYKVRVTDPKTDKSYVRFADREKITQLRGKGLKVEMTEYGTPYEGERKKGEQTAKALGGGKKKSGKLDPVGKEDKDIDNDGDHDKTDKYLLKRRKAIGKAIATRKEEYLADGTTSLEPTGKKINPTKVDNYKSGAVKLAPTDEADPQNGYGVKEEVEKKDNRANYAYINFMKNKLRAGMGVKNVMPVMDPDEAEKKFEKVATSTKATAEDDQEDACENKNYMIKKAAGTVINKALKNPKNLNTVRAVGMTAGGAAVSSPLVAPMTTQKVIKGAIDKVKGGLGIGKKDVQKNSYDPSVNQALDALKEAMTSKEKYKAMYTKKQEEDKKKKKTGNPAFDDESHHSNAKNKNESVEQALDALKYSIKKNPPQLTELNRYEKEKGEDTKTGKKIVKGGTAKNDKAFQSVMSAHKDERMGANEKKKKKGEKKEEGGRILRMQNKKKEQKKKDQEFAERGKKKGYKSTQDYANVVARYGGEKNMEKGRGLGS